MRSDGKFVYIPGAALLASLGMHLLIPVLLLMAGVVTSFSFLSRKKAPDLYQNFIQVDMVDLPDQTTPQKLDMSVPVTGQNTTAATPEPALPEAKTMTLPEVKTPPKVETKPIVKPKDVIDDLALKKEREKALKKLQEDAKREAAINALLAVKPTKAGRAKIKGNLLSQGTSQTGKLGTAQDRYKALVTAAIKEHFNIYAWQKKKKGLIAVVTIQLYPNGRVRDKHLDKSATDSFFNSAVLQAIDEAQPLPVPDDLAVLEGGITIEFRPEE